MFYSSFFILLYEVDPRFRGDGITASQLIPVVFFGLPPAILA